MKASTYSSFAVSVAVAALSIVSSAGAAAFTVYQADPYNHHKYGPDEKPNGGVETTCVKTAAALGEVESSSFMVCPETDMELFDLKISDLTGPGATLPASAIDLCVVKSWYRPASRWFSTWRGGQQNPELLQIIIVHDDDLIRVDEEKKINYLRVDYPAPIGPKYLDMRNPARTPAAPSYGTPFNDDLQPLKDAKSFVPIKKLEAKRYKQFYLTYRIPAGQKPGVYRGKLVATANGKSVGSIDLELKVYPFSLPEPRTHYDTAKPYVLAFYGTPSVGGVIQDAKDLAKTDRKLLAVYRNMAEHNVSTALGPESDVEDGSPENFAVRQLMLMRKAGMSLRPMMAVCGGAYDFNHMETCKSNSGHMDIPLDKNPEAYAKSLKDFREKLKRNYAFYDKFLGHHDLFMFGPDECGVGTHQKLFGYYSQVLAEGGKVYGDYSDPHHLSWALSANNIAANMSHRVAWQWHRGGADVFTYACPFCGCSCPDTWRRHKGLRFYMADFDGVAEYNFTCESNNRWNDFIYRFSPYGSFGICYLTSDGIIDTIAWNGLREGYDDVRYYSLLRLRAEAAMKSKDKATVKLGRQAIVWFDSHDPELILDLDAFRAEVAGWIERLIAKVGPETGKLPGSLPVADIPPPAGPKSFANAKDGLALANKYKASNRYDLAIAVTSKIRTDKSVDFKFRVDAAVLEAGMLADTMRRDEAVKILEPLAVDQLAKRGQRGRLYLAQVRAMLSDYVFEEKFSSERLAAAGKPLAKALDIAEVPIEERITAILSYGVACVNSDQGQMAIDYLTPFVDFDAYKSGRGRIAGQLGRSYRAIKDYKNATKWIKRCIFEYKNGASLQEFAEVADAANDYETALGAYTLWRPTIDQKEDKSRYRICCQGIVRMTEALKKQQKKAPQKNVFEDTSSDEASISLDEE